MTSHYVSLSMNLRSNISTFQKTALHWKSADSLNTLDLNPCTPQVQHDDFATCLPQNPTLHACPAFEINVVISEIFQGAGAQNFQCMCPALIYWIDLKHWISESIFRVHVWVMSPYADWKSDFVQTMINWDSTWSQPRDRSPVRVAYNVAS